MNIRDMIDSVHFATPEHIYVSTVNDRTYMVITHCDGLQQIQCLSEENLHVKIDLIEHENKEYYQLEVITDHKKYVLCLNVSDCYNFIACIPTVDKLLLTSEKLREKVFEPSNVYLNSIMIDTNDFLFQHIHFIKKLETSNVSPSIIQKVSLVMPASTTPKYQVTSVEIGEFEECVYVNYDYKPLLSDIQKQVKFSFDAVTNQIQNVVVLLHMDSFRHVIILDYDTSQSILCNDYDLYINFADGSQDILESADIKQSLMELQEQLSISLA